MCLQDATYSYIDKRVFVYAAAVKAPSQESKNVCCPCTESTPCDRKKRLKHQQLAEQYCVVAQV